MTKQELAAEKKQRFAFANAVYEATNANELNSTDMREIGRALGLNSQSLQRVVQYLQGEGLIRSMAIGGAIGITHKGIVEIESAIEKPNIPTEHFPAINYIHIGEMHHSQIQQGTHRSSQTQNISEDQLQELKDYIYKFRNQLPSLNLSTEEAKEAEAELNTLEAQADSSRPKASIINLSLAALKELLMHTVGALGAHELIAHLPQLFS